MCIRDSLYPSINFSIVYMKIHLISGGCGFVGKNMVRRLYNTTNDYILFIDNLIVGIHPSTWINLPKVGDNHNMEIYGYGRLLFIRAGLMLLTSGNWIDHE